MHQPITVLAPIKLAEGISEADLLAASDKFQIEFVDKEPGVLRRELVAKPDGGYLDIVQFRSREDAMQVMEKEKTSAVCHAFFSIMDLEADAETDTIGDMPLYSILAIYD